MTHDELVTIVRRSKSTTLFAYRMREALGLPQPKRKRWHVGDRGAKSRKYRGIRKLMRQKHGVDLR